MKDHHPMILVSALLLTPVLVGVHAETATVSSDLHPEEVPSFKHPTIKEVVDRAEASGMGLSLEPHTRELALVDELLVLEDTGPEDPLALAVERAKVVTQWQADVLGLDWAEDLATPEHDRPSDALTDLAQQHQVEIPADERERIQTLDDLEEPVRSALTDVIDAYIALDAAATDAYNDIEPPAIMEDGRLDVLQGEDLASLDLASLATELGIEDGSFTVDEFLQETTVDLSRVLPARNQLLDAIVDLRDALDGMNLAAPASCSPFQVTPSFSIDLNTCDNTYTDDYALQIDAGGSDTYHNNAGGSGMAGCDSLSAVTFHSATLIDLEEANDEYGDPGSPRRCGVNGGGYLGAGVLLDEAGNEDYNAADFGVNGGAFTGSGLLLDVQGNDNYTAGDRGTNGGGDTAGTGLLLDTGGSDEYKAGFAATNGGGLLGNGALIDSIGGDIYNAADLATNGGAGFDGSGFLFDSEGSDIYEGGACGVNGGAFPLKCLNTPPNDFRLGSSGLLVDGSGSDSYDDQDGGTGMDKSVFPKGPVGAQVDVPTLPP